MRTLHLWSTAALVAGATIAMGIGGCGPKKDARGNREIQPVGVTLAKPIYRPVRRTVDVVGTLFGQEEVTISAKVAGRIERIDKDIQDAVLAGGQLAQIEQTDYLLGKRQKELAILQSLASLGLTELPGKNFKPENVATVKRARLQADNAKAKYERGEQLHGQNPPLISDQDFADLRTAWDVAESNYRVELLGVDSVLAQIAERQAELDLAKQRLDDTIIRTPVAATQPSAAAPAAMTYYVVQRLVSAGEYVKEGTPLYRVVADDLLKLRAAVPERYANVLSDAMSRAKAEGRNVSVDVSVAAFADKTFEGTVARVNPQVDAASRTFQIEVLVPNAARQLKSGAFARAAVNVREDPQVLFVPQATVVTFAGESKLFRVKGDKAVQLSIQTGERWIDPAAADVDFKEWVEAVGLTGDDPVVLKGASKLAQDVPVKLSEGKAATKPASRKSATPDSEM